MRRNGVVIRFGAENFGFIRDFNTKRNHLVHISDVIGRQALHSGDKVTFQLGRPRLIRNSKTRAGIYSAQAILVELVSEEATGAAEL
jgi:cold shock CspA family protein